MEFSTKIDFPKSKKKIDYTSSVAFIGSCFAENISNKFIERKFHTLVNPFGIIYNPLSIENMMQKIAAANGSLTTYTEKDVFYDGESWSSWDAHGSLSVKGNEQDASVRAECARNLNKAICESRKFLSNADLVFITLGTAFVYFLKETGKVVSNCHKQNASLFERRLISVEETTQALRGIVESLKKIKNDIRIVFTVSPLRHLNDGAHGNNLSKSTLLLAIDNLCQEHSNCATESKAPTVDYFPSYEIVLDELRDYRFYADDMIHLSATAENYIFERMSETFCSDKTIGEMRRVERFMKTAKHHIVSAGSAKTVLMAEQQIKLAEELEKEIDGLDLSFEKKHFKKEIP